MRTVAGSAMAQPFRRKIAAILLCLIVTTGCTSAANSKPSMPKVDSSQPTTTATEPTGENKVLITDFNNPAESSQWRTVNDTVMGGNSQSEFRLTPESTALFTGTISLENNGGFSSVRRRTDGSDFANAQVVTLRVKGDGLRYQLRLKMSESDRAVSYRTEFDTRDGEWITLSLDLDKFEPVFRGRIIEDAPALVPAEVQEIGILLGDKQSGEFELEIDWIRAE
ncbi:MAG: CIA30 family protein [Cyanobacteria bacterium J06621_3]